MASKRPDHPLTQLSKRLRDSKYRPTKEDLQALVKCRNEVVQRQVEGALAGFGAVFFFAQRLGVLPRLALASVSAVAAGVLNRDFAMRPCIRNILRVEGSPLSGELLHILQTDFPQHPDLKAFLEARRKATSQVEFDEDGDKSRMRLPPSVDILSSDQDHSWGQQRAEDHATPAAGEGSPGESGAAAIRQAALARASAKSAEREGFLTSQQVSDSPDMGDIMVDPFSFSDSDADESEQGGEPSGPGARRPEVRKSRMSAQERRELNRKQYLEWEHRRGRQQQQPPEGNSDDRSVVSQLTLGGFSLVSYWASPTSGDAAAASDGTTEGSEASAVYQQLWAREARRVLREAQAV